MPEGTEVTPPATPAAPAAPIAPKDPETFSREYVTELRSENKSWRQKHTDALKKAEEAEIAGKKAQEEAAAKIAEADAKAQQRIIRAELKAAALKAGMIDLDGLKLADLSALKLNDAGEVEGADALMESLKKSKPYLFGTPGTTSNPTKSQPGNASAGQTFRDLKPADQRKILREKYGVSI